MPIFGVLPASGTVDIDLVLEENENAIDFIQSAAIDNADGAGSLTFVFGGSRQRLFISPGEYAERAVFAPRPLRFSITGAAGAAYRVWLFNVPLATISTRQSVVVEPENAPTASQASVASSAASVTLRAASAARKGLAIYNDSTAQLFLLLGAGPASATAFTIEMDPSSYYEVPFNYTGIVTGVWSAVDGAARVTEVS